MSQQQDVARAILESPTEWTATVEIAKTLGFPRSHCASYICELRALKHIESRNRGLAHEHRALPSLEIYVHNAPRDFQRKGDRYRKGKPADIPLMPTLAQGVAAMRTNVADSSIAAFHAHRANGRLTRQQRDIFEFLCKMAHRDHTRKELSRALNMEPGTVAARVFELIEMRLVEDLPIRRCNVSGNSAHPVRLADPQVELFA